MDFVTLLLLIGAGFIAGVANAIAGGGTFFTLPIFLSLGLPPIVANATNALAVYPGHLLASWNYRALLRADKHALLRISLIGLVGAIIGVVLLYSIGNAGFRRAIPVLIGFATLIFVIGPRIRNWLNRRMDITDATDATDATAAPKNHLHALTHMSVGSQLLTLAMSIYGGFFSAALGILLMALLLILGVKDLQTNNAYKNAIASVISSVAVGLFTVQGWVNWHYALPAFISGIGGGIFGARMAQKLPDAWLRRIVIATGCVLTAYYGVQFL